MSNRRSKAFRLPLLAGVLFLASGLSSGAAPRECHFGQVSGFCRHIELMKSIRADHDKYVSDRSVLWVEKDYLSESEAGDLKRRIDKGIAKVEKFLGMAFAKDVYHQDRIEFYIHGKRRPSHTITTYLPRKYLHPIIFLSFAKDRRAPYLHEIVHIVAWDWNALWIKEGLAVVLNDRLDGYSAFPNFGQPIDDMAADAVRGDSPVAQSALELVGEEGVPRFKTREIRRLFYILSGSYVGYLERKMGIGKLMEVYGAKDTAAKMLEVTGEPADGWKREWLSWLARQG